MKAPLRPLYNGPQLAVRGAVHSPHAVQSLYQIGATTPQVVALLLDEWEAAEGRKVARACRSADLEGYDREPLDADGLWVKSQIARRRAFLEERVIPLLKASGRSATVREAEAWIKSAEALAA